MYHMITNKRGKTAHVAGRNGKPLCSPTTKVAFHMTLIGRGMTLCATCAERELLERHGNGGR